MTAPTIELGELVPMFSDAEVGAAPEQVTVKCSECGEIFTGEASGRKGAGFQLGRHLWAKHKISKKSAGRKKTAAPTDVEVEAHPIAGAARSVASEIGVGKKGAPSSSDLAAGGGRLLHIVSAAGATFAVSTDNSVPPEQQDGLVDYLTLPEADATAIMSPIARMLAPTGFNKKFGRGAVDNIEVVTSFVALGEVLWHWRNYMQARGHVNAIPQAQPAPTGPIGVVPPMTMPGAGDEPVGRVITAEDVAKMRG